MLTERRDYLLSLIQQASAAARRLRELLTGDAEHASEVIREADQAIATLLGGGGQAQLLERVDAKTAVQLLGDEERLRIWVELLRVQAEALLRIGARDDSARLSARAAALEAAGHDITEGAS